MDAIVERVAAPKTAPPEPVIIVVLLPSATAVVIRTAIVVAVMAPMLTAALTPTVAATVAVVLGAASLKMDWVVARETAADSVASATTVPVVPVMRLVVAEAVASALTRPTIDISARAASVVDVLIAWTVAIEPIAVGVGAVWI